MHMSDTTKRMSDQEFVDTVAIRIFADDMLSLSDEDLDPVAEIEEAAKIAYELAEILLAERKRRYDL